MLFVFLVLFKFEHSCLQVILRACCCIILSFLLIPYCFSRRHWRPTLLPLSSYLKASDKILSSHSIEGLEASVSKGECCQELTLHGFFELEGCPPAALPGAKSSKRKTDPDCPPRSCCYHTTETRSPSYPGDPQDISEDCWVQ